MNDAKNHRPHKRADLTFPLIGEFVTFQMSGFSRVNLFLRPTDSIFQQWQK
jgi:hypothetical protein